MINGKSVLVTICARSGSKGILGKNLKVLGGKSLIQWTTDLLDQLKYMDNYVVSTDSDEILRFCNDHHMAHNSYKRPAELATDTVSRVEAVKHAVEKMESFYTEHYDIIVDLGVATPFKTAADVNEAIMMLYMSDYCHRVTTAFESNHNPYFDMMEFHISNYQLVKEEGIINCRQEAPHVYTLNDAVNVWWRENLFGKVEQIDIHEMPPVRSIHLDTPLDWLLAEAVLKEHLLEVI